jgi:heme oxygenase
MSLKELTADKHDEAEKSSFMKAVFAGNLPIETWTDWTFQRILFYHEIEIAAEQLGLLEDLPGIKRSEKLFYDYMALTGQNREHSYSPLTAQYADYIKSIDNDPNKILAHLYVWHMGDMFGGQMIKNIIKAPQHSALEFDDAPALKTNLRAKLDDSMGEEANIAFDWAIKLLNAYEL